MPGVGTEYEDAVLDSIFGDDHATVWPNTLWLAMFNGDPNGAGVEVTTMDTSYARVELDNDDTNFPPASGGIQALAEVAEWSGATDAWGPVSHWAFMDASVAGDVVFCGRLGGAAGIDVAADTPLIRIPANTITIEVR